MLPKLAGFAIFVCDAARLTACRGKLFSGDPKRGSPVYAATFVRERKIVLDTDLLRRPRLLRLIFLHELFHFVWVRLGNRKRHEFAAMLRRELENCARGEMGESSGVQKERVLNQGSGCSSQVWRDYACEAFCDTAAWLFAGKPRLPVGALTRPWRERRERWLLAACEDGCRC